MYGKKVWRSGPVVIVSSKDDTWPKIGEKFAWPALGTAGRNKWKRTYYIFQFAPTKIEGSGEPSYHLGSLKF